MFYFFTWRDVKVRYRQTAIGAAWAIIQPLLTMVVFTVFLHNVAGVSSGNNAPYAIFAYSGLIYWNYFSSTVTYVSNSLVSSAGIITKTYFPRVIPPVSSSLLGVVDFFFAFIVFIGLMIYYHTSPTVLGVVLVIPMLLLSQVFALGIGILFAALNVKYRDVRTAMPFIIQIMLFVTPVIYSVTAFPQRIRWLINLNPMAGVISTMRASLIGQGHINWGELGLSVVGAVVSLAVGLAYFAKTESKFVDII